MKTPPDWLIQLPKPEPKRAADIAADIIAHALTSGREELREAAFAIIVSFPSRRQHDATLGYEALGVIHSRVVAAGSRDVADRLWNLVHDGREPE